MRMPGIDAKNVCSKLLMLLNLCIDLKGRKTRAVLKTLRLVSFAYGVKVTRLETTMKKSMQFHDSLR